MKSNAGLFTTRCIQDACMAVICNTSKIGLLYMGYEPVVTIFGQHGIGYLEL